MKQLFLLVLVILSLLAPINANFLGGGTNTYYVSQHHGNDNNTGLNNHQPKKTINNALKAANEGDTIIVCEGQYKENIEINKAINLIGENPTTTIIDGNKTDRCIYISYDYLTNGKVVIQGFTIQNGNTPRYGEGGGICIYAHFNEVTISHCIITNNTAINGGGVYGEFTMHDCIIANNTGYYVSGVGGEFTMHDCIIINNKGSDYGEAVGGTFTMYDSIIANNIARKRSIIYQNEEIKFVRCMILYNKATDNKIIGGNIFHNDICLDQFTKDHTFGNIPTNDLGEYVLTET